MISLSGKKFRISSWRSIGNNGFKNFINIKINKPTIIERNKALVLIIKSDDNKILIREFLELVFIKNTKLIKSLLIRKILNFSLICF